MPFWTYMLHCNAGRLYTGHTDHLERRIADHKAGRFEGFTKNWLPVELVWSQEFGTRDEAKAAEKRIKGWSRAKKLALIRGDWEKISRLAKSKGSPSTSSGRTALVVSELVLQHLKSHAKSTHPHEACGLLLGQPGTITHAAPTKNVHPTSQTHFEIDPRALIDAHKAERAGGLQLLGFYHSHPSGKPVPSATDQAMASGDGRIWAIIAHDGEVRFWRDAPGGFTPLSYSIIED